MESLKQKSIRAKLRFKALVRLVIANLRWLSVTRTSMKPKLLRHKGIQLKETIPLQVKALLNKPAAYRTEEEKLVIYRVIDGNKCFRKYPENVKMLLAGCICFAYYGPGRVIVKESHSSNDIYFIIEGDVSVTQSYWDPILQEYGVKVLTTLTKGDSFGEGSLLYNDSRRHTLISLTPVEFLVLHKDDFEGVLKDTVKSEWDRILAALARFTYFDAWEDHMKKDCCFVARIKEFRKDETILGEDRGAINYVHFVLKGKCRLIEYIVVTDEKPKQPKKVKKGKKEVPFFLNINKRLSLDQSTNPENNASPLQSMHLFSSLELINANTRFMQVGVFSAKACFGVGESLNRRTIIAMTNVECLLIPLYWLKLTDQQNVWMRITRYLQQNLPTTEELLEEYKEQKKWREYTKEQIKMQIKKRPCNCAQNVPYSVRIKEDFEYSRGMN